MRLWVALAAAAAIILAVATEKVRAESREWPTRPVRIIVPAAAGGPYDRVVRPLAEELSRALKQSVLIDNRPSAGSIVGTRAGANAAPDGYTLTVTGTPNAIADSLYENVPFDIVNGFEHIGAIGQAAQWLMVRSDAGIASLQDLIDAARREPGCVDYASSGVGTTGHLVMEQLQRSAGIRLTHVPYKGGTQALQDVMAGVVPIIVMPPNTALAEVRSGRLKVLALSSATRSPQAPAAPTFAELGYPQLTVSAWMGLSAPKGTHRDVVQKLNTALRVALENPAIVQGMRFEGIEPLPTTPEQYARMVRTDTRRWEELVRRLGLKPN